MYLLNDVSFGYVPGKHIFDQLSMEIKTDEIILLTGRNGSGKTTFCRLLMGFIRNYDGSILFGNKDLVHCKTSQIAEKVLYLKQEGSQNVVAVTAEDDLKMRQHRFKQKDEQTFINSREEALSQVHLTDQKNKPSWELSTGQLKRVGLAALPIFPSQYWILDEPLSGLDSDSINRMMLWLRERRKQGLGALIINHIENIDASIYHVHYHLDKGKMIKV